jgi:mRNA-degrading endonuclease toxin of MazEF toxin-antitoxin module
MVVMVATAIAQVSQGHMSEGVWKMQISSRSRPPGGGSRVQSRRFPRGQVVSCDLGDVPTVGVPDEGIQETRNDPASGVRTCVVVRAGQVNAHYGMSIVVPLTGAENVPVLREGDVLLPRNAGGLTKDSVALTSQVRAIDLRHRLRHVHGELEPTTLAAVDSALKGILGLA